MRLELWHERSMSFVKRFSSLNVPLCLVQLHYVRLKSLVSRKSDIIILSLETINKSPQQTCFVLCVNTHGERVLMQTDLPIP